MKAFVVARYGKNEVRAADVPEPRVGNRDVLVKVSAASINPLDIMVRNGEFKQLLKYKTPFVLGHDVAGVVTKVGADVRGFTVGDEVFARPRDLRIGTFAEYIAIDEDDVALKPASLSAARGRSGPVGRAGRLADPGREGTRQARAEGSRPRRRRRAGVHRHPACQASRGTRGDHRQRRQERNWSATSEPTSSSTTPQQDFAEILSDYDLVLDSLGGENLIKSLTVLKPGGLAIGVTGPPDAGFAKQLGAPKPFEFVLSFLSRKVRKAAKKLGVRYSFFFMHASGAQLRELAALYDAGHLRPVIDSTFAFDQTLQALAYVENGKAKAGKVVVTLD